MTIRDDVAAQVPPKVLDWVALKAYQFARDDEPPITHERVDVLSVTYARGKRSKTHRLMKDLLRLYRARTARII